jgi:sulfite oxidase
MKSRREFLKQASGAVFAAAITPPVVAQVLSQNQTIKVPGEDRMVLRSFRFVDLESPVEYFNTWLTPVPHFFVRNHMFEPSELDADEWRLAIGGEVEQPLTLSYSDLRKMEAHSVVNTLECAGNGRAFYRPQLPGIQWGKGAVGNARFSGPRLRDVLQRAGVKPNGKHLMFRGLDDVPGKVPPFIRSIPIEKALDGHTLIATHMNGSPLTKHHGFPARLLVPGWIGSASCKWLTELKVLDTEFAGNFMSPGYRMPNQPVQPGQAPAPADTHPLTALTVKSVIAGPSDGANLKPGRVLVHGAAWAGEADVVTVDISVDGGASWNRAALAHDHAHYAWRLWSYPWRPPKNGDYEILSRATDSQGRVQPVAASWNPGGYLNNSIDRVSVHVA